MFASHVCLGSRSMFRCVSDPVQGHTNVLEGYIAFFNFISSPKLTSQIGISSDHYSSYSNGKRLNTIFEYRRL